MVESRMTPLLSLLLSFSILFLVLVSIGDSLSSSLLLVSETFTEEKRLLHALHMTQVPKTKWTRTKKREDYLDVVDDLSETVYTELNERLVAFRERCHTASACYSFHLRRLPQGRRAKVLDVLLRRLPNTATLRVDGAEAEDHSHAEHLLSNFFNAALFKHLPSRVLLECSACKRLPLLLSVDMSIRVGRALRIKRATELKKEEEWIACQMRSEFVDFSSLGWKDFVLQPKGFFRNSCKGNCRVEELSLSSRRAPCCRPIAYKDLKTGGNRVESRILKDFLVAECGC